jgi:hypothetical protein
MNTFKTKRIHRMNSLITVLLVSLIGFAGCKQDAEEGESTTKSLDNFAKQDGEALTVNTCGSVYTGKETLPDFVQDVRSSVKGADEYRNVALGVMTAVPERLLGSFFGLNGKVIITAKAESICQRVKFAGGEKDLLGSKKVSSCWHQPALGQPPEIILPENKEQIKHSLLRLFAYTFTEGLVAATASSSDDDRKNPAKNFIDERDKLSRSFLYDLRDLDKREAFLRLDKFRKADPNAYANYFFAEAIDSYYCSDESRAKFQETFRKTWKRFTDEKKANSPVNLFGVR